MWVDASGTRRRLQALSADGWSASSLAEQLGVTRNAVVSLRRTDQTRVLAATAASITALYEQCWWRTPPGRAQSRTELWARRAGWAEAWRWRDRNIDDPAATPLTDPAATRRASAVHRDATPTALYGDGTDEVAIARAVAGTRTQLTRAERYTAIDLLELRGASAAAISAAVGVSERTVVRRRAARRQRRAQLSLEVQRNGVGLAAARRDAVSQALAADFANTACVRRAFSSSQ